LRGLGKFLYFAKFDAVICADCGHYLLFAEKEAIDKLREGKAKGWTRIS